jgi:predicted DNA-binding antitoxin AbrB/MazE fold protein
METLRIEAVYERGVLKLPHELPLRDGQTVTITIQPRRSRLAGLMPWRGTTEALDYLIQSDENDPLESP